MTDSTYVTPADRTQFGRILASQLNKVEEDGTKNGGPLSEYALDYGYEGGGDSDSDMDDQLEDPTPPTNQKLALAEAFKALEQLPD